MADKKRILLVAAAFHPVISPRSFRATELARELARQGHAMDVITAHRDFDYGPLEKSWALRVHQMKPARLPRFNVSKKGPAGLVNRILSRVLLALAEYPSIEYMCRVRQALKNRSAYDILITVAVPYPVHWGAALRMKKEPRVAGTWIADCGDPYFKTLDSFRQAFYFKYVDRWYSRKPDYITVPHEGAVDGYLPEVRHKIRIIPQGFNFPDDPASHSEPTNPVPTFAYAGGFIPGSRDPAPLLRYLAGLEMPFKFLVYTKHGHMIAKYLPELEGKVEVRDYIPREELMKVLSTMDFLINLDNNTPLCLPSKLIDYAITGRPVLNIGKDLPESNLLSFLRGDYSGRLVIANVDQYRISNVASRFVKLHDDR